ncbi:MAG: signal recognition particle protein [Planctomycetaceae bacterium]|jgi:signal recognition particle subunit SRP54|nr:signal recognition particle protein [Planctomycetaceae bacterium]
MFEYIQDSLRDAIKVLCGNGRLTESNMRAGFEQVRRALLDADVSISVVDDFIARVSEKALGISVKQYLDPTKQLIKIVQDELIALMGPVDHSLHLGKSLSILMLCGLQGSGKTTTCGKFGKLLLKRGHKPMLVAADLQRPAAIDQLAILGDSIGAPVYVDRESKDPVKVCRDAVAKAKSSGVDVLVLDTAGRLHIDEDLMEQLAMIDRELHPDQIYFVVDAMTGQDAVNSAKAFNDALTLDGVILTKLDGDTRGGAALSVKHVTGVPIKFIGTGEVIDTLEEFHPDRMAGRILGMGDILSLIEQAAEKFDNEEILKNQERLRKGMFTLDDFRAQMGQVSRLGSFSSILKYIPGMGDFGKMFGGIDMDTDNQFKNIGGIIDSMTREERENPVIIDGSRRRRIARGAGVDQGQVSGLIKMFLPMAEAMKNMSTMNVKDQMQTMQNLVKSATQNPTTPLKVAKVGTGKRLTTEEKRDARKQREKEKKKREKEKRNKK